MAFDTMVASYLLDAGERNHNLDDLAKRYLNYQTTKIDELIGKGKNQKRMDEVPVAEVGALRGAKTRMLPLRLAPILAARLQADELEELNATLEVPLIEVLAELEYNGIRVDVDRLAELSARVRQAIGRTRARNQELAGHPFNIASPKQLPQVLFHRARAAGDQEDQDGPEHRRQRAGGTGQPAPAAGQDHRVPAVLPS